MLVLMKTLHFFGLMMGGAGGIGNMLMAIQARRADGPPSPDFATVRRRLALVGLTGILLLWVTGVWMWLATYNGSAIGTAFVLKIVAATLILAIGVAAHVVTRRTPPGSPPPAYMRRLRPISGLLALIAVALAVVAFN